MTKLKIGDNVVMNDRYYDKHQGEVFTIKAGPEMIGRKECFWLDGYDGAYCADGLDLYKPPTNEEWFCALPTKDKAKWLYDHYVNAREEEFYGRPEKTLSEYQKWLVSVHREIDGTKID